MRNVFTIEKPRKKIFVFGNSGGYTSGTLLKQIDFRSPKTIQKYKEANKEVGDVLCIDNYIFLIVKKHFANKLTKEKLEKMLKDNQEELLGYSMKTTNDDHSKFKELILTYIPDLEYRETGEWKIWD